jgi:EAL domain-containing protein (putative c-di-GMP-specific phosphodiesterase class I)/DNA-binding ferritin-like protein
MSLWSRLGRCTLIGDELAMTHSHTTPNDIDREAIAVELHHVLVTLIDLALIGKHARWNVVGPGFRSLHLELDELIDEWRGAADAVGERMAALGGSPDGRAETVAAESELPTLTEGPQPDRASLTAILIDAVIRANLIRARMDRIEDLDPVTADLLHWVVATLEEQLRSIRAQAGLPAAHSRPRRALTSHDVNFRIGVAPCPTENELRRALEAGELRVHYQPIVGLSDRQPIGVEALVRWQHPDRGLLSPREFIAVAEESGLIGELGLWVLRESCRQAAEWQRTCAPDLLLSVNVSGRQIAQPAFPPTVTDIVRASGLTPGTLMLEITESVLMEEAAAPMTVLSELRDHDLRLVLDDFGTGFSSLSYLQRFPLEGLKLDQSFVATLDDEADDGSAIVDAVTRMASGLGLRLVAEGVETETQAARLTELGCSYAQGYLFARPMPATRRPSTSPVSVDR